MTGKPDYFDTFVRISKALGSTLALQEILDLIVTSAIETTGEKAACLFLADEEKDIFVPVAQKGLSDTYVHARPMPARKLVDDVVRTGYLAFRDATTDPRLENHEEKKAEGIASILVVPVMVSGKPIGVLSLYTANPRDFTETEINFQVALAEQGAMAIERARLFDRLKQNSKLFSDLATTINSSLDIKHILHILTADIADAFGLKGVTIRLLDKEKDTVDLVAAYALSEDFLRAGPVCADRCMEDVLAGRTVVVRDATSDPCIKQRDAVIKEGVSSVLCIPIKSGDEVIGVMNLFSAIQRDFPEEMVQLVTAIAHQGGLAIRNASMYLILQEDKKSLEQDIWSHRCWF
jgi:GAF domain-containing protein